MKIYKDLEINDELTLGDMRAIQKEFGKPFDKIDWGKMDGDVAIQLVACLVQSARKEPLPADDLDFMVRQIPMSKLPDVIGKLVTSMPRSSKKHKDGNLQEGNGLEQASKTSTARSA